jgi:hypothetical protein
MHQRPPQIGRVVQVIPRLMGLFAVLPLFLGLAWITWSVTQDTLRMQREWKLVEAKVIDASGYETIKLAITHQGVSQEVEFVRSSDFKSLIDGEVFPAYQNPADPRVIKRGGGAGLWGNVGVLAFFTLFLGGVFVFLMRVKPLTSVPPMPGFSRSAEEEELEPEEPLDRFRRPGVFSSALDELVLRMAPRAWKAALFWGVIGLLFVLMALGSGGAGDVILRFLAGGLGLAWAGLFAYWGIKNKTWELRLKRDRLVLSDRFGSREIPLNSVRLVVRGAGKVGSFRLLDDEGKTLLSLDADAQPPETLKRLLARLSAHTGKPIVHD